LLGHILLSAAMLIAVLAGGSEVIQPVGSNIHTSQDMLDGHLRWSGSCEWPFAVAAFAALTFGQVAAHPRAILRVAKRCHPAME
jgi:hypothetical protein